MEQPASLWQITCTVSFWQRTQAELALVDGLTPLLHRLAQGREISGLSAYEQ